MKTSPPLPLYSIPRFVALITASISALTVAILPDRASATPTNAADQYLACTVNDADTGVNNNQWQYDNNWGVANVSGAYNNDEHFAFATGANVHFRFHGSQVQIYTVMEPHGGNINYSLDGGPVTTKSNYASTIVPNTLSYTSDIVDVGDHDLVISVAGSHQAESDSNTITVDRADVYTTGIND